MGDLHDRVRESGRWERCIVLLKVKQFGVREEEALQRAKQHVRSNKNADQIPASKKTNNKMTEQQKCFRM